nr:hypothetical transcript [Hymenolepis microstoma]
MTANENCTQNEPHYDQMRRRYIALRWKSDTIRTLLKEYEELVEKTGGKTAKPPLSASKSRSFSFHNLWRIGKRSPRENLTPLSANITNDSFRMQEIENHIADLSGSIHFQANTNVLGSNCPTISSSYQLRLNITQADPERSSSILNLPSYSRTPELFGGSSANILASPLHEWNFTVRRRRSRPSIFKINEPSTFQSDTEPWEFSSTESFLPMEPCATLIADVILIGTQLEYSASPSNLRITFFNWIIVVLLLLLSFLTVPTSDISGKKFKLIETQNFVKGGLFLQAPVHPPIRLQNAGDRGQEKVEEIVRFDAVPHTGIPDDFNRVHCYVHSLFDFGG